MNRLDEVRARIDAAAVAAGRAPDAVTLVVVSKERSVEAIEELYARGHRHFGENRAQELAAKVGLLPPDIVWHFIGPLQTNKVRIVRPIVALLHSLDRPELAPAWVKGGGLPPPALIQVNIGGEATKHGLAPAAAPGFAEQAAALGILVKGVMAIPPPVARSAEAEPYFRQLAAVGAEVGARIPQATELSMGMSDDFETAVAAGATIVRVGRAIFEPLPN
jgi:pyridoxal phosphate enzyme (YggS family)